MERRRSGMVSCPIRSVTILRDARGRVSARISVAFRMIDRNDEHEVFVTTPDVEAASMAASGLVTGTVSWPVDEAYATQAVLRGGA